MRNTVCELLAVGIAILQVSQPAFAEEKTAVDSTLRTHIAEMMQAGYVRGPHALRDAQIRYESLSKGRNIDPRIDYAHGLVLLRQMKNKEAQEVFLTAIRRPAAPYLPAWEALIWTDFASKNYVEGYDHVLQFARLVCDSEVILPDDKEDALHWMGLVMFAIELTVETKKGREAWVQNEKKLTDLLDDEEKDDYNRGKDEVKERHASLEDDIQHARDQAKKQHEAQLEKKQNRIDQSLEAVKEKREKLKKSAEEMKEALAEQTAAYQKQMVRLEKDYGFFERRSVVLVTTMAALDQEAALLQERKKNLSRLDASNLDAGISQLQGQRALYNAEFLKTTAAADEIAANARRLNQERLEFLDQYQQATGEIVEADAGAEKWKERTLNQAKSLKKAKETAKPPAPTAKIQVAKTFRTYVELDLFAERTKLLSSFGIVASEK